MQYLKTRWNHDHDDQPVTIYSEIETDTRMEVRKIEQFADGRSTYAMPGTSTGATILAEKPIPALQEITEQSQFDAQTITAAEFDAIWTAIVTDNATG
ncbi:DUF6881 domain-containing protein [Longispora albida]|uniref:DUF6881 domain-containing protein n=1 Tax=Longispora albida TaxID=203523 RepID=UPI000364D2B1|nr:hypothetical protein [Longispora albida]